jgi:hypothetical protein
VWTPSVAHVSAGLFLLYCNGVYCEIICLMLQLK